MQEASAIERRALMVIEADAASQPGGVPPDALTAIGRAAIARFDRHREPMMTASADSSSS